MVGFVAYDPNTGVINSFGLAPKGKVDKQALPGEEVLEGDGTDVDHYVDLDSLTIEERQSINVSITTNTGEATVTNIPSGSAVTVAGESVTVDDGELTVTFDAPGTYKLTVTNEPKYLPFETEVTIP